MKKGFLTKTLDQLYEKEDPTLHYYGIYLNYAYPMNLKRKTRTDSPHQNGPIEVIYNRDEATVRFVSRTFEYDQTGLPKDKNFTLVVGMNFLNQVMEVKLYNFK